MIEPVRLRLSTFRHPEGGHLAGRMGVVAGFALRCPAGVVVLDTGIGFGDAEVERWYAPATRPIADVLLEVGIVLGEVVAIVNSHLHFDHAGQNGAFPGVPIVVGAAELVAAREPDYTVPAWIWAPGLLYRPVEVETEVAAGVRVIPTPGHTPGHLSVWLEAERTLLVGQAVYTRDEWEGSDEPGESGAASAWDLEAYASSVGRLQALGPRRVLFAHDEREWRETG